MPLALPSFLLHLLLRLGQLLPGVHSGGLGLSALLLLCGQHLLSLDLGLLHGLLLLSLRGLLLGLGLPHQLLLLTLLPGQLLLLLGSDLFPLGLFVLESLQFLLLFRPLIPPLGDVLLQLFVQLILMKTSFPLSKGLITFHRGL